MHTNKLIDIRTTPYHFFPTMIVFLIVALWGGTARAEYKVGATDVLSISVYGEKDLKSEIRVSADGRITFPLVGVLQVTNKSTFQVEKMISEKLASGGFVRRAQVTVNVLEYNSQRVSVLGHINSPGRYSLESTTNLLEVVAMAGGIKETGGDQVILTRYQNGHAEKRVIDLHALVTNSGNNELFVMQPGDVVYVNEAPLFYIYGQVQRPGGYPVGRNLTVVKALSLGGGLTPRGTQRGIVIKRKNNEGTIQEIDAELTDPVLKEDVLFIEERWF